MLRSKIEGLPDDHRSKPKCLFELSQLFDSVGHYEERRQLLTHALKLSRERRDDLQVARILMTLSEANTLVFGLHKEGIEQAEEALEIYKRFGDTAGQAECSGNLAWCLFGDYQFGAAEDILSRTIDSLPEKGQDFLLCRLHSFLGMVYNRKGEKEKGIDHLETALGIAYPFNWHRELYSIHYCLADVFGAQDEFEDANTHIERAKSHTVDDTHNLAHAVQMQARIWVQQRRLEDARLEASRALEIYEKLGAAQDARMCRRLLQQIERVIEGESTSSESDFSCESSDRTPFPIPADAFPS